MKKRLSRLAKTGTSIALALASWALLIVLARSAWAVAEAAGNGAANNVLAGSPAGSPVTIEKTGAGRMQ